MSYVEIRRSETQQRALYLIVGNRYVPTSVPWSLVNPEVVESFIGNDMANIKFSLMLEFNSWHIEASHRSFHSLFDSPPSNNGSL